MSQELVLLKKKHNSAFLLSCATNKLQVETNVMNILLKVIAKVAERSLKH